MPALPEIRPLLRRVGIAAVIAMLTLAPVMSAETSYDRQLMRLAEVLGSVHFLHHLCGEKSDLWRIQMESLLAAEAPSDDRRAELIANFNHGYRSFAAVYSKCTDSALQAIEHYMKEGEALTNEMVQHYGE